MKVGDLVEFKREACAPGALKCYPHLRETGLIVGKEGPYHLTIMFPSGIKHLAKGQIRKAA